MSGTSAEQRSGTQRYSVPQAARYLGISERAVRKRIVAGSLVAERDGRQWTVFLPAEPKTEPGAVPGGTGTATVGGTAPEPAEPIEADYRLAPSEQQAAVVNLVQQMLEPFIRELGETKEELGRVTAERDQARQSADVAIAKHDQVAAERDELISVRDTLRGRLSALEAQQVESPVQASSDAQTATDAATAVPWWMFWKR